MNVSFDELYQAYADCRKHKRSTESCIDFEFNEIANLNTLCRELNEGTYRISPSYVFVHHEPDTNKYREVFAANFRDRIVQHLVVNRIESLFEHVWTDRSFSCRKGKGTKYAADTLHEDIKRVTDNYTKDNIYVATYDIDSFFASIDKNIMYNMIKRIVIDNKDRLTVHDKDKASKKDVNFTLHLIRMIVFNDCRKNCIFKQPRSFWKNIPGHKSAFHSPDNKYLAVGNITSQMFANMLLVNLDKKLESMASAYGRYVDDMYAITEGIDQQKTIHIAISEELSKLGLKLKECKTHIQKYDKGVKFVGKIVKCQRMYIVNKTKGKCIKKIRYFHEFWKEQGGVTFGDFHYMIGVVNSYLGLFKYCNMFKIKKRIIKSECMMMFWKYCRVKSFSSIKSLQKYRRHS